MPSSISKTFKDIQLMCCSDQMFCRHFRIETEDWQEIVAQYNTIGKCNRCHVFIKRHNATLEMISKMQITNSQLERIFSETVDRFFLLVFLFLYPLLVFYIT